MEVLCGQIVIALNNCSSMTSLYVLTGSVHALKNFGLDKQVLLQRLYHLKVCA